MVSLVLCFVGDSYSIYIYIFMIGFFYTCITASVRFGEAPGAT
jgi:hypothetical protein